MKAAWWNGVALRVRAAPRCALFLDFDGTLAELTKKPDDARLPAPTRPVLRTLVGRPKARVFFISGRRRSDLVKRVRLSGCRYLGLFGFESTAGAGAAWSAAVQRLRARAEAGVAGLPHVWIEDKGWRSSCTTRMPPRAGGHWPGGGCERSCDRARRSTSSRARTGSKWCPGS